MTRIRNEDGAAQDFSPSGLEFNRFFIVLALCRDNPGKRDPNSGRRGHFFKLNRLVHLDASNSIANVSSFFSPLNRNGIKSL